MGIRVACAANEYALRRREVVVHPEVEESLLAAVVDLRKQNRRVNKEAVLVELVRSAKITTSRHGRAVVVLQEVWRRIELLIAQVFINRSMNLIRARLRYDVQNATGRASELGRRNRGDHFELVYDFHRRRKRRLAL